jgi:hypothetical protein
MTMMTCPECGNTLSERERHGPHCRRHAARSARAAQGPAAAPALPSIVALRAARPSAWLGAALLMGIVGQVLCSVANHAAQTRQREEAARVHAAATLSAVPAAVIASDRSTVPTLDGGRLIPYEAAGTAAN